jgi:4-amino-4-deoxy-L-arabinose transferase-like glycosyltransferase
LRSSISNPIESQSGEDQKSWSIHRHGWALLLAIWAAVFFLALFSPSLLDDADATHANAARAMALSGDWVTLRVDGIRYLEKPPLPYWLVAGCYRVFGFNAFATHLPSAISVLLLMWLAWTWALRAYGTRAAFYAALSMETAAGVFLFTRIFIPEVILAFLIAGALYAFLLGTDNRRSSYFYLAYTALALGVLTKGLIAPGFFLGAVLPYLLLTGEWRRWREFRVFSGALVFLLIAAPWHILAALRNPGEGHPGPIPAPGNVHGFLWFYFVNEHWLRFLGQRYPRDYNKLPGVLYWTLHLVWLFPWSLWLPAVVRWGLSRWRAFRVSSSQSAPLTFAQKTTCLLFCYAAFILIFFSLSTNQEYYTFPAYFPLLVLTAAGLPSLENSGAFRGWVTGAHAVFVAIGIAVAAVLGYGLWASRSLPFVSDIGSLLAHRGVGDYTLSMSHFFDLTTESFAALRLPALIAAVAFAFGPAIAWWLRARRNDIGATLCVGLTSAVFLIAAHIALVRFEPMLSSRSLAETFNRYTAPDTGDTAAELLLYGDQSYGSSVIFYTGRQAFLVNGRTSSMIWGSDYSDAPPIFLTDEQLKARWGQGTRKFLFVPLEFKAQADQVLGKTIYLVEEISGKSLYTDRPIAAGR